MGGGPSRRPELRDFECFAVLVLRLGTPGGASLSIMTAVLDLPVIRAVGGANVTELFLCQARHAPLLRRGTSTTPGSRGLERERSTRDQLKPESGYLEQ